MPGGTADDSIPGKRLADVEGMETFSKIVKSLSLGLPENSTTKFGTLPFHSKIQSSNKRGRPG
jgi:hypothetical protein